MKGKIIFLIIPFLFSICPIFAASEEGDYLTSEEEILEALSRDEISFTQYYDLIELFREKVSVFGEDIDRLLLIPGVDERWIEAIRATSDHVGPFADKKTFIDWFPFDFERISAFVTFEQFRKGNIGGGAKIYTHGRFIENDLPTSYFTVNARYAKQKAEIRFSQDKDSIRVRRRGIEIPVFNG